MTLTTTVIESRAANIVDRVKQTAIAKLEKMVSVATGLLENNPENINLAIDIDYAVGYLKREDSSIGIIGLGISSLSKYCKA